jgi:hypothetical protein
MADISPAADAIWTAFNDVAERVGVFEDYGDALAAALRELAERINGADGVKQDVLDIAAELEGTHAPH